MVVVLFTGQFADCSTRSPLVRFLVTRMRVSRAGLSPVVCSHALTPSCAIQFSADLKVPREKITQSNSMDPENNFVPDMRR